MAYESYWPGFAALIIFVLAAYTMGFGGKNHFPVKGRTIIVTGASQGTGRCVARLLAERGANVIVVARTVKKLEESIAYMRDGAIDKQSQRFHLINADLTVSTEPARVLSEATAWNNGSPPDIVWCCHGAAHPTIVAETPVSVIQDQISTNYLSNAFLAHASLKEWLGVSSRLDAQPRPSREPRHLVFTSSVLAFLPILGYGPYSPAKAALRSLADTLSMEARLYESTHVPIRIHTVFPATIFSEGFENETKLKSDVTKKLEEDDGGQTPDEIARLSLKALENGDEMISTTFIGRLAMAGMFGITKRNGAAVFDLLLSWVAILLFPLVRLYLNGQVTKWGRENNGSAMKKK